VASKTYRERVEELNQYLSSVTEHHDIPRVRALPLCMWLHALKCGGDETDVLLAIRCRLRATVRSEERREEKRERALHPHVFNATCMTLSPPSLSRVLSSCLLTIAQRSATRWDHLLMRAHIHTQTRCLYQAAAIHIAR
jgi:hypothetical protein